MSRSPRPPGTRAAARRSPAPAERPAPPPSEVNLRLSQASAHDLDLLVVSYPLDAPTPDLSALTPAQHDVTRLAAGCLDDDAIARLRGTSPRTVARLLAQSYRKLGVGSRAQLITLLSGRR